jgi:thymidylate synthase (FAD)
MKVELISVSSYTGTLFGFNKLNPEELLIAIARVSSDRDFEKRGEDINKLLAHCYRNKHWSVFDMVDVTFYIETSIAIAVQILRHWSLKFQMFSQRYQTVSAIEPIEFRARGKTNRQSSEQKVKLSSEKEEEIYNKLLDMLVTYRSLIEDGVSNETARFLLPMCTKTELFAKGSLRSWIHYLEQRESEHAQKEHREIASRIRFELEKVFPVTFELIKNER